MDRKTTKDFNDLLPPSPKRSKPASQQSAKPDQLPPPKPSLSASQALTKDKTEFPVTNLDDFYKHCPTYRLPVELGAFSLNEEGKVQLDSSELRYYVLPAHPTRPNFDLNIGFAQFVTDNKNVPSEKLSPILKWISCHGDSFRPRAQPLSPDGINGPQGQRSSGNGVLGKGEEFPTSPKERPDDLLTNFVTWRGLVTKMMCSPYNKTEPWSMAATCHRGTVYLSEIETEEAKERSKNQTPRMDQMCYWGHKFEDYLTSKEPPPPMKPSPLPSNPSTPVTKPGTVNDKRGYCTVVRTRMNTHSLVMAAEVDCSDHQSSEKPPRNYIELKTSRVILTDRNTSTFKRYKLMKWWAQSFLVGVPKIICGFRDDEGIVRSMQTFRTSEIPKETQHDLSMWQPAVCLNFLDDLLSWIRKTVTVDDPNVVYLIEWRAPYTSVTCTKLPPNGEYTFLPTWYINKQSAPEQ